MGPELLVALSVAQLIISAVTKKSSGQEPTADEQAALDLSIAAGEEELKDHVDRITGRNA